MTRELTPSEWVRLRTDETPYMKRLLQIAEPFINISDQGVQWLCWRRHPDLPVELLVQR